MTRPNLTLAAALMGAFVLSAHAQTEEEADNALAPRAASTASTLGRWTHHWFPASMQFSPMSLANLPNGRVLLWSGNMPYGFTNGTGSEATRNTYYAILDLVDRRKGDVEKVVKYGNYTNNLGEMFCTGTTMLTDGSILLTGGSQVRSSIRISMNGSSDVSFVNGPVLNQGRSYNSTTLLTDGSVFTIGGSFKTVQAEDGGTRKASFSPGGERLLNGRWSNLTGIRGATIALEQQRNKTFLSPDVQESYRSDNHAWLIPFENNTGAEKVFHAGPIKDMHVIDLVGSGRITPVGVPRPFGYRMNGSVARVSPFHLLVTGGAASYGDTRGGLSVSAENIFPGKGYLKSKSYPGSWDKYFVAKDAAHVVNMRGLPSGRPPVVTTLAAMPLPRVFATSVVLPGGDVLITGGQSKAEAFTDNHAVMDAELYTFDPATKKRGFKRVARPLAARTYHSAGILLPNATVLMVGGGGCDVRSKSRCEPLNETPSLEGTVHRDYEIYEPPYLHKGGTRPGTPAVQSANRDRDIDVVGVPRGRTASEWFTATSTNCKACRMELIRHVSVTHGVNNDQLRVPLERHPKRENLWRVPDDAASFVLGGNYMLFAIDRRGVPSFGRTVRVQKQ